MKKQRIITIRIIKLILVVFMFCVIVCGAVAEKADSSSETRVLKFSTWSGADPESKWRKAGEWFLDEIEKRSDGRIKFERYWLGTLVPAAEELGATGRGVADLCLSFVQQVQDQLSLLSAVTLPAVQGSDMLAYGYAMSEYAQLDAVQDQAKSLNIKIIGVQGGNPRHILSVKPIKSLEDLKGVKIRATGQEAQLLQLFNAVPVGVASAEAYEALERGTIDANCTSPVGAKIWKWWDVAHYYTLANLNWEAFVWNMNLDTWNSLPKDLQDIILEIANGEQIVKFYELNGGEYSEEIEIQKNAGNIEVINLSPEDELAWRTASEGLWEGWVKLQEKKNLPGREMLEKWFEIIE